MLDQIVTSEYLPVEEFSVKVESLYLLKDDTYEFTLTFDGITKVVPINAETGRVADCIYNETLSDLIQDECNQLDDDAYPVYLDWIEQFEDGTRAFTIKIGTLFVALHILCGELEMWSEYGKFTF